MNSNNKSISFCGHRILIIWILCLFGLGLPITIEAQTKPASKGEKVFIDHADKLRYDQFVMPDVQIATGRVKFRYKDMILEYQTSGNTGKSKDTGVELMMHFNKIEAINTQFTLSGSYTYSESDSTLPNQVANTNLADTEHRYILYPRDLISADKLSLRLTATYHLSFIGLLTSLTIEQFTFSTQFASVKERYPLGYLNGQLQLIPIPEAERSSSRYQALHRVIGTAGQDRHTPIYHNFHLRITKELQNGLSLSFYINNVANYHPKVVIAGSETRMNEAISFGATATFNFGKL